ncbi:MAG: hypothetical protein FVQ77_09095 [Cytophagales bacterium]|nr:hypothetical protein [Cytophagales bacterium]
MPGSGDWLFFNIGGGDGKSDRHFVFLTLSFNISLVESKKEIPFFINRMGKPLYHLSVISHRIMTRLYRSTEIFSGR